MKKIPYSGPHTLYHYTNLDGIRGILTSHSLWISDVRSMNDKSEYQYAVNMMIEKLRGIAFRVPPKYERALNAMEKRVRTLSGTVFAFCLTAAEDRLSQWRGYSECSLGFNGKLLHENAIRKGFSLKPVLYAEHRQTELLNVIEFEAAVLSGISPDAVDTVKLAREYATLFLDVVPFIKHFSFFEEEEWRLAVHRVRNDKRKVHFRKRKEGTRVAYLIMPLTNPRRLFTKIIVGPTTKQKKLIQEAVKICEEYGLKIPVVESSSPYRSI